jgi:hypothetical protein
MGMSTFVATGEDHVLRNPVFGNSTCDRSRFTCREHQLGSEAILPRYRY